MGDVFRIGQWVGTQAVGDRGPGAALQLEVTAAPEPAPVPLETPRGISPRAPGWSLGLWGITEGLGYGMPSGASLQSPEGPLFAEYDLGLPLWQGCAEGIAAVVCASRPTAPYCSPPAEPIPRRRPTAPTVPDLVSQGFRTMGRTGATDRSHAMPTARPPVPTLDPLADEVLEAIANDMAGDPATRAAARRLLDERRLQAELERLDEQRRRAQNGQPPVAGDEAITLPSRSTVPGTNESSIHGHPTVPGTKGPRRPAIVNSTGKKGGDEPPTAKGGASATGSEEVGAPPWLREAVDRVLRLVRAHDLFNSQRYSEAYDRYCDVAVLFEAAGDFGAAAEAVQWMALAYEAATKGTDEWDFELYERLQERVFKWLGLEITSQHRNAKSLVEVARDRVRRAKVFREAGYLDVASLWADSAIHVMMSIETRQRKITAKIQDVWQSAHSELAEALLENALIEAESTPSDRSLPPDIREQFEEVVKVLQRVRDLVGVLIARKYYRMALMAHADHAAAHVQALAISRLKWALGDDLGSRREVMESQKVLLGHDGIAEIERFARSLIERAERCITNATQITSPLASAFLDDAAAYYQEAAECLHDLGRQEEAVNLDLKALRIMVEAERHLAPALYIGLRAYSRASEAEIRQTMQEDIAQLFTNELLPRIKRLPDRLSLDADERAEVAALARDSYIRARHHEHQRQYRSAVTAFVESAAALVGMGAYGEALVVLTHAANEATSHHEMAQFPAIQFIRDIISGLPGAESPMLPNSASSRVVLSLVPQGYDFQLGLKCRELLRAIVHPSEDQPPRAQEQAVTEFVRKVSSFGIRDRDDLAVALHSAEHPLRRLLLQIAISPEEIEEAGTIMENRGSGVNM